VLAELCHAVALVLVAPFMQVSLEEVRFLPLSGQRVLAVVLTRAGRVAHKVVRTREPYSADELGRMTAYLNQNFRGWSLEAIRTEMERRVAAERSEFHRFLSQALALCQESCHSLAEPSELHLDGRAHLLEQGAQLDPEAVRELLQALEEKERLAQLLRDCVESAETRPLVRVGLEPLSPSLNEFVLIGAGYSSADGLTGTLGLVGPARMDYARAITAVSYVAALFSRALTAN
jgi:heat-inducible transcriptional repressor